MVAVMKQWYSAVPKPIVSGSSKENTAALTICTSLLEGNLWYIALSYVDIQSYTCKGPSNTPSISFWPRRTSKAHIRRKNIWACKSAVRHRSA